MVMEVKGPRPNISAASKGPSDDVDNPGQGGGGVNAMIGPTAPAKTKTLECALGVSTRRNPRAG